MARSSAFWCGPANANRMRWRSPRSAARFPKLQAKLTWIATGVRRRDAQAKKPDRLAWPWSLCPQLQGRRQDRTRLEKVFRPCDPPRGEREIRVAELQRERAAEETRPLQPGGEILRQRFQSFVKRCRRTKVPIEGGLDAQRTTRPVRLHGAVVLGVGHPPIVTAGPPEGGDQLMLTTALQIGAAGDAQPLHATGRGRAHAMEPLDRQRRQEGHRLLGPDQG